MDLDRMKRSIFALFKASVPRLDYYTTYFAKVVQQQPDTNLFDLLPDDPRIPSMGGVPLRNGEPGVSVSIRSGATVLVGWENGDPSRPWCGLFGGGEVPLRITLTADQIILGGDGSEAAVRGETLQTFLNTMSALLITHFHTGGTISGNTGPSASLAPITPPVVTATKVRVV